MFGSNSPSSRDWRGRLLGSVIVIAIAITLLVPPIPQDASYHLFADARTIAGIPNFWNVISNFPFLLFGVYGLFSTPRLASQSLLPGYLLFCLAVIAVSVGSAYYHHAPSTPRLVWDRLPMSIAFMALFALILGDRVNPALGRALLGPLVTLGVASVFYWAWTESRGVGDLRPYALVQFLPIVLMVLMLVIYRGSDVSARWLWLCFGLYFLAKITEYFDAPIYRGVGFSGHTMKHLLSAAAVLAALMALLHLDSPERRAAARHELRQRPVR
jgi:hypothetical protein